MQAITTDIQGVVILEPRVFRDDRGYFFESYKQQEFDALLKANGVDSPPVFVQDNQSCSTRGVMRGLHFQQPPFTQAKLVRCVVGAVLDVAVDLRKGSPTYGGHVAVELSADNFRQLFIPRGFAHGFAVLSDVAVFQYKVDNPYAPGSEGGISILDSSLNIPWPFSPSEAILAEKDTRHPLLTDFASPFAL